MCAPVWPGTVLGGAIAARGLATFRAPWWAPGPYKAVTYALFCGGEEGRPRTVVEWSESPGNERHARDLVAMEMLYNGRGRVLMERRRVVSAKVLPDSIVFTDVDGKEEGMSAPWSV